MSGFPNRKLRRSPFEDAYQKFDTKEDSWRRTLDRRDITADKANIFNRGGVLTQFQLFDNYELSTLELVPQTHPQMKLQWSNIFSNTVGTTTSSGPTTWSSPLNKSSQQRTWEARPIIQHPRRFNLVDLRSSSTAWMAQFSRRWLHIACNITPWWRRTRSSQRTTLEDLLNLHQEWCNA